MSDPTQPHIHLGADHGGFELKEKIRSWLETNNYRVTDHGASTLNPEDDYPPYAFAVGEAVAQHSAQSARGILVCRSSGGVTVAANKVTGVRAVAVGQVDEARHAVEHNNANVICLSADWTDVEANVACVKTFLATTFKGEERHVRRINQIVEYERTHAVVPSHFD